MGEERIKSDEELKKEQAPLSHEQLEEVAGGAMEQQVKFSMEQAKK
jgi:hypothetical protein